MFGYEDSLEGFDFIIWYFFLFREVNYILKIVNVRLLHKVVPPGLFHTRLLHFMKLVMKYDIRFPSMISDTRVNHHTVSLAALICNM